MKKILQFNFLLFLWILLSFIPFFTHAQNNSTKTLYFKSNSYSISKKHLPILNEIGRLCASDTFSYLKIFAYADIKGSKLHNELLSKKRAEEIYSYLIKNYHFDTTRVYMTWLGEETAGAYDLHFPAAHTQQRCVDIIINFKKK